MKNILIISFLVCLTTAQNQEVSEFLLANNLFANDLYKQLSQTKDGNFLVSPFSAETALAFTQSGAKGDSAEEIRKALYLPNDKNKVESAIKTLLLEYKSSVFSTLQTTNKIYVKENFAINEDFKNSAKSVYQADVEPIDFTESVEAAKTINNWVGNHTNNKIKNLVLSQDLDETTRAVLINALYFKAHWSTAFIDTRKSNFFKTPSDSIQVDTLYHHGRYFNYFECPHMKAQFLELPFRSIDASMIIMLPNEKDGLSALESQIDSNYAAKHQLQATYLNVALPKFKIETTVDLKEILKNLGVEQVFDPAQADLSGIAGKKGELVINKVAQKTFIDVNAQGVEAAAATVVSISKNSLGGSPSSPPKDFIADHPFMFVIKVKDVFVFIGRVTDPSEN